MMKYPLVTQSKHATSAFIVPHTQMEDTGPLRANENKFKKCLQSYKVEL